MNTRFKLPAKLEKDHEWLVAHMDKIAATFAALGKLSAADLAPLWAEYDSKMRAHLLEEEAVCIPLLRAYFTPQETGKIVESILSKAPAVAMGSVRRPAIDLRPTRRSAGPLIPCSPLALPVLLLHGR